jgi:S-adenosylmethionine:diacylglycerol 3-amino-3-carboxypropyl transferase
MKRQYTINSHPSTIGRTITFSESDLPNMLEIIIYDSIVEAVQRINIERAEWEQLMDKMGKYSHEFTWNDKPTPPSDFRLVSDEVSGD